MILQREIDPGFDLLDLHCHNPQRYPFFLESGSSGPQGQHDILFACPADCLTLTSLEQADFLSALDSAWSHENTQDALSSPDVPFRGGWFLYLSYELAGQIEPQLSLHTTAGGLPVASATRIPAAVIHDRASGRRYLVAESAALMKTLESDIEALDTPATSLSEPPALGFLEEAAGDYLDAIDKIKHYIREGDVFQVNLSRLWQGNWPDECSPADLYRVLRAVNPGPFNGLACWGDNAVLSSSPERLVSVREGRIHTRPIAGTRPRGTSQLQDKDLKEELRRHPKEVAEHIMLIDLERNDLGRVARTGSVQVTELMSVESYATVHHIVSNVEATQREGVTPGDVIRAVFPGGTITGCPKVRCMEIIAELEQQPRGAYTGSIGYLNRDGSMDLNILIRSMVREGQALSFRAGAGIVYDSQPEHELQETRHKAAGLLNAFVTEAAS